MELRKVQKTGGSTFTVSLPKPWAVDQRLEAGDALAIVQQQDGSLRIAPSGEPRKETRTRRISVDERGFESASREIIAAYLAGYDTLEVRSRGNLGAEVRDGLRQLTRKIIGPEIVDESSGEVVVRDLLDPAHLPIRKGVQRMFFIAKSMHRDAIASLDPRDEDLARDVVGRDDDVDRLFWLVSKQYNLVLRDVRKGEEIGVTPQEGLDYLLVARTLERIADHARRIAETSLELDEGALDPILDDVRASSERALDVLEEAFGAFFTPDTERANAAVRDAEPLERAYDDLLEEGVQLPGRDAVRFAYILESLVRTGAYASDIAEVAINHAVTLETQDEDGD